MDNDPNLEFRKIKSLKYLYEVNENGTVFRNAKSKKQLKIKLDFHHSKSGYYTTFIHINGRRPDSKTIRVMIHRVVAECWLGDIPNGMEVDHIDRNTHNNDYRNLRYVTKGQQMQNRNHTNISATGSKNLEEARRKRMKPVKLTGNGEELFFESFAECSRSIAKKTDKTFEHIRYKLKAHRSYIYGYKVEYLNAETRHGSPTGQGIVHSYVI